MDTNVDYNAIVIDGVDTAQGIKRYGGKAERYMKTTRMFAKTLPNELVPFENFLSDNLKSEASGVVHTLKGVAGNLGMTRLYESLIAFEDNIKASEPDETLYNAVKDECVRVSKEILEKTEMLQK